MWLALVPKAKPEDFVTISIMCHLHNLMQPPILPHHHLLGANACMLVVVVTIHERVR